MRTVYIYSVGTQTIEYNTYNTIQVHTPYSSAPATELRTHRLAGTKNYMPFAIYRWAPRPSHPWGSHIRARRGTSATGPLYHGGARISAPTAEPHAAAGPMSSSTVTHPSPLSDGLSSLVLSKRYLACAKPLHVYKLEHKNCVKDGGRICTDDSAAVAASTGCWPPTAWVPSPSASAVQARYEPSDVFTPLVFEEITQPIATSVQQHLPHMSMWLRPVERNPSLHVLQSLQQQQQQQQQHPPPHHQMMQVSSGNQRRPLQHLPPPAQSSLQPKSSVQNGCNNKPGDLSWLVNFQVASIFEPTCNGTTGTGGGNVFGGEWQEPETLKLQKKKTAKTDQKRK